MDTFVLKKKDLTEFLRALGGRLIAPVTGNGVTQFAAVQDPATAALDLDNYTASPKKVLFPQTETLFCFKKEADTMVMSPVPAAEQTVVFGIRPCDAKSFVILDRLFGAEQADPYYQQRRQATVLVGLACSDPTNRCFCTSLGGNPGATEGLDALCTDIGEEYFLEVLSPKGGKLLAAAQPLLTKATAQQIQRQHQAIQNSTAKIRRSVDLQKLHQYLPKVFSHPVWQELGDKCIGCGICTYNCPTCHCFDIQDEGDAEAGRRIRVWDACMYPEFTLHASGENPRHDRSARIRNRVMHKFAYFPLTFGHIACVGCGRCIELCPVNEDIINILNKVRIAINE